MAMAMATASAACESSPDPTPTVPGGDPNSSSDQLASRLRPREQRDPGILLAAAAAPPAAKPVLLLAQVEAKLKEPASAPVLEALGRAGLEHREMAILITGAAAHNSSTGADPVLQRLGDSRARFDKEMRDLDRGIFAAEQATGTNVDRVRLFDRLFGVNAGGYGSTTTVVR